MRLNTYLGITGNSYSLQIPRDEYRIGMWYRNGDHKAGGSRLKKFGRNAME